MIIYKSTNKITGKSYIGYTTQTLKKRKDEHFNSSYIIDTKFYRAIRKYGFSSFKWSIIDKPKNLNEALKQEIYYIKKYDTHNNGYNSTLGGEDGSQIKTESAIKNWKKSHAGYKHSEETKRKISKSNKNNKIWIEGLTKYTDIRVKRMGENVSKAKKGQKFSDEHKKNLSLSHKGKKISKETIKKIIRTRKNNGCPWHTLETRKKIGNANKGRTSNNKGKKMSEEQKIKISISKTKKINDDIKKEIIVLYEHGMNIYKISKEMNLSRYLIYKIINNNGGTTWQKLD